MTAAISAAALHEQVETTERLITLADQQADDTERRYCLGAVPRSDWLGARQNADVLAAGLPPLRQQWQAVRHSFAVLLGRTPDKAPTALALADLQLPEAVPVVVPSILLHSRPDVEAAESALKAAAAQVGVATAQMFPQLTLSASMGQAAYSWPTVFSGAGVAWGIGASLAQPLFHGER